MVHIVALHKVLENGSALPYVELLPFFVDVGDGWNPTVWIDVEEPLFFLLMFEQLDLAYLHSTVRNHTVFHISLRWVARVMTKPHVILQAQFFKGNGDLQWVWGPFAIESNGVLLCTHVSRL